MSSLSASPSAPPLSGTGGLQTFQSPVSPPLSYLSARRPSLPALNNTSLNDIGPSGSHPAQLSGLRNETPHEADTQEEDGKFKQSLQIDMRSMVGDSVGNMSISPTSRDIVLAARKGLFIIDLESPLEVPRFLPQGGTWDVADVQWNPNPSHAEYIVSTSSERLLIWNLLISGKTSIEFILQSHYRAITDINWHTFDPDLVCSTGIDSWIWAWDIRDPQKPAFGLCAFNAGGTQVKWNRKDGNILASSHLNEVLIWDRRKGSIPVSKVKAHDAKIYGIDWSHSRRNEIITCSLDKTIKIWNTNNLQSQKQEPSLTFHTDHPVWRARDLPFGRGVLSLPQRGETSLGMWSTDDHKAPVETFEGHTDVVKEFVWRSHGNSNASDKAFQLITWSKDKTLRFWPVGRDVMRKAGAPREASEKSHKPRQTEEWVSFRSPPLGTGNIPALSAPRGHRSILDGIRATLPTNPVLLPHHGSAARASRHELPKEKERERPLDNVQRPLAADRRDGTMSKGNTKGGRPRMGPAILSNFLAESVGSSRLGSESRPPSAEERSRGRGRTDDGPRDSENATSLLDEINSVVNKLTPAKIKLERHGLTKHRSCTFGLHGPWGESSVNVFVRVTFTFPRDYPHGKHPRGTPLVEIERSPLISVKMRAHMKKGLKDIRESQRPCLEACLRFLLFSDGGRRGQKPNIDSGTSDEDEPMDTNNSKDFSASLIRDHPNLAEPRSSQGVFGPNGQLVCIFRSLPRLVKAVPQDLSATPAISSQTDGVPRLFQSPLQLSKAVRRLAEAMNDHSYDFLDSRNPEGMENILGIMNNLLSFSHPKDYTTEPSRQPSDNAQSNYSLLPKRMTIVFIKDRSFVVGAHRKLATQYSLKSFDLLALCRRNSEIAHRHARFDHERLFNSLVALFRSQKVCSNQLRGHKTSHSRELIRMRLVVNMLHEELLASKDVQLLAMFAIVVLQIITSHNNQPPEQSNFSLSSRTNDYFSLRSPASPSSPTTPTMGQSLSSSSSSRGSWSSLFNAGSVRHLIGGAQEHNQSKIITSEKSNLVSSGSLASRGSRITLTRSVSPRVSEDMAYRGAKSRSSNYQLSSDITQMQSQMFLHVLAYAEMLHGWQLLQKRAELFKAVKNVPIHASGQNGPGIVAFCQRCGLDKLENKDCRHCSLCSYPLCTVCRTPVKGISHNCIVCCHTTHLRCWNVQRFRHCPSGCGCECKDGIVP